MLNTFPCRFTAILLALCFAACSGGGGGGGGGGNGVQRGTKTAVRVIHGAIDESPVEVEVGPSVTLRARFAEQTFYEEVSDGPVNIVVRRANSPEVIAQLPVTLAPDTEYTVLLSGPSRTDDLQVQLIADQTNRPAAGSTLVRFVNAYNDFARLRLSAGASETSFEGTGGASQFIVIPAGLHHFRVIREGGQELSAFDMEAGDQGEITVTAAGARNINSIFVPVYHDLD